LAGRVRPAALSFRASSTAYSDFGIVKLSRTSSDLAGVGFGVAATAALAAGRAVGRADGSRPAAGVVSVTDARVGRVFFVWVIHLTIYTVYTVYIDLAKLPTRT
jgi:hypothetical protein